MAGFAIAAAHDSPPFPVFMNKLALGVAAAAATLVSSVAMAQAYVSADVGTSHSSASDSNATSWKVTGGYKVGAGFAGEIGYVDFGNANTQSTLGTNVESKAAGVTLGAAYEYAFDDRWSAVGRLGVARIKTSTGGGVVLDGAGNIIAFIEGAEETDTVPYYGLAGTFAITRNIKLEASADWSRAKLAGSSANVRSLALGARYEF
jgi:hypothetical protein